MQPDGGTQRTMTWALSSACDGAHVFFCASHAARERMPSVAQADALDGRAQLCGDARTIRYALGRRAGLRLALRTVGQASDIRTRCPARGGARRRRVELGSRRPARRSAPKGWVSSCRQRRPGLGVDPTDADANLDGTIRHLSGLLAALSELAAAKPASKHSIAAYNAGAGAVDRYGGIPPYPETQTYVRRVIGLWRRLAGR